MTTTLPALHVTPTTSGRLLVTTDTDTAGGGTHVAVFDLDAQERVTGSVSPDDMAADPRPLILADAQDGTTHDHLARALEGSLPYLSRVAAQDAAAVALHALTPAAPDPHRDAYLTQKAQHLAAVLGTTPEEPDCPETCAPHLAMYCSPQCEPDAQLDAEKAEEPTIITHHRTVFHHDADADDAGLIAFSSLVSDDDPSLFRALDLSPDVWDHMGRPETVTVTVEPHDRLNVPEEPAEEAAEEPTEEEPQRSFGDVFADVIGDALDAFYPIADALFGTPAKAQPEEDPTEGAAERHGRPDGCEPGDGCPCFPEEVPGKRVRFALAVGVAAHDTGIDMPAAWHRAALSVGRRPLTLFADSVTREGDTIVAEGWVAALTSDDPRSVADVPEEHPKEEEPEEDTTVSPYGWLADAYGALPALFDALHRALTDEEPQDDRPADRITPNDASLADTLAAVQAQVTPGPTEQQAARLVRESNEPPTTFVINLNGSDFNEETLGRVIEHALAQSTTTRKAQR